MPSPRVDRAPGATSRPTPTPTSTTTSATSAVRPKRLRPAVSGPARGSHYPVKAGARCALVRGADRVTNLVELTMSTVLASGSASSNACSAGTMFASCRIQAGVPRLDRVDRHRRGEIGGRADLRQLLLVGADREVLERDRGGPERARVVGRPAEVEAGLLDRVVAERLLEGRDVRALVGADDPRLLGQRAVQRPDALGLRVEARLQILEREREIEDRDVVASLLGLLALGGLRARGSGEDARARDRRTPSPTPRG